MNFLKKYKGALVASILMFYIFPIGLFIIFMSGDSCCGEDTSGTMTAATFFIIGFTYVWAIVCNFFAKLIFKDESHGDKYNIFIGSFISTIPYAVIFLLFLASLIA